MSRKVTVHHFVANLTTRQYGQHPTSDLLGVNYWHDVPADAEFPRAIGRMDLFTRFYLQRANPVEFFIRTVAGCPRPGSQGDRAVRPIHGWLQTG